MTFIVNILHTKKTLNEHILNREIGHVSKYGKLFSIFPMSETRLKGGNREPGQLRYRRYRIGQSISD